MPSTAINIGRILILIGIGGYTYGLYSGNSSMTALIPAAFGTLLMIIGYVARAKDSLRKHLMHLAVLIGFLGFLMPLIRVISKISEFTLSAAVVSQLAMSVTCLAFVIISVRSFLDARSGG